MSQVCDLGSLEGPVLVFGGPYGNLEACDALLAVAGQRGIAARNAICTGDVVAYGADPQAVVDRLRAWGCAIVMGNCEESLAADAADCGCGFNEGSTCAALSAQWFSATRRALDIASKQWMGALPRRVEFTLAGRRLSAIHGAATQINKFIFASTDAAVKRSEIAVTGGDGIIAGHCGMPFTDLVDGKLWHNSGALGLPANDGSSRVWYSILTPQADGIEIAHYALAYDHERAAAKMRVRGYPAEYADTLASGLWPSCDILPRVELGQRGQRLDPPIYQWAARIAA
jgi:predicted phosphodiesterase